MERYHTNHFLTGRGLTRHAAKSPYIVVYIEVKAETSRCFYYLDLQVTEILFVQIIQEIFPRYEYLQYFPV